MIISLIGSNVVWYKLYNSQRERVKNSLIPPLTNDYYSNQLILTNDIKKYEGNFTYNGEVAISGKYNYLEGLKQSNFYDVPLISQLPTYPNGCEAASAVMLLNY